MKRKRIF